MAPSTTLPTYPATPIGAPEVGRFYWLPEIKTRQFDRSIVRHQAHINNERVQAGDHPTVVYATYEKNSEVIARCLQVTSFTRPGSKGTVEDKMTVEEKYPGPRVWYMHLQYVPIMHKGEKGQTRPLHNMPVLETVDDEPMKCQSYVHLDHYFEIEAKHLRVWKDGPVKLKEEAMDVLMYKLQAFEEDCTRRNTGPGAPRSPLEYYPKVPKPNIDAHKDLREMAARGLILEKSRLKFLDVKTEYTGWEYREKYWEDHPEWPAAAEIDGGLLLSVRRPRQSQSRSPPAQSRSQQDTARSYHSRSRHRPPPSYDRSEQVTARSDQYQNRSRQGHDPRRQGQDRSRYQGRSQGYGSNPVRDGRDYQVREIYNDLGQGPQDSRLGGGAVGAYVPPYRRDGVSTLAC